MAERDNTAKTCAGVISTYIESTLANWNLKMYLSLAFLDRIRYNQKRTLVLFL
ncbi:MAG: hypothetical protein IJ274_06060 [Lachnospiraceae bacterium]|nr:hypothetical protein [Lachnospiraceae bacterium]